MYTDAKSRIKEDNSLDYLVLEMNLGARFRRGEAPRRVLKKVEPMDSKTDDLLQLADLLTGCVNNHLGHVAGERKQQVRRKAEDLGLIGRENILVGGPERNGP